jgi:hypothetical protein
MVHSEETNNPTDLRQGYVLCLLLTIHDRGNLAGISTPNLQSPLFSLPFPSLPLPRLADSVAFECDPSVVHKNYNSEATGGGSRSLYFPSLIPSFLSVSFSVTKERTSEQNELRSFSFESPYEKDTNEGNISLTLLSPPLHVGSWSVQGTRQHLRGVPNL